MGFSNAVPPGSPFTIHNIPYGIVSTKDNSAARCAVAIGDHVIDLAAYSQQGKLDSLNLLPSPAELFSQPSLNAFAAVPRNKRLAVRRQIIYDISNNEVPESCVFELQDVTMHLPFAIGGYSDFYTSLEHVQNCSPMTDAAIPENWFHAPCVYNGRVSSIVPSPQAIRRPRGVYFGSDGAPVYGPSQKIDFELELGYFVSKPISHGSELDIRDVEDHIFGFVLLNDWSARDLQAFEMKPLGPFHGKGFGTSISPWVVTMEALEPFRCAPKTRQDPAPFPHLEWPNKDDGTFEIALKAELVRDGVTKTCCTSNARYLYWTPFQQITHHAAAMCGLQTGDLIGTGTISGSAINSDGNKTELGCFYEASQGGAREVQLPDGTQTGYLRDGDEMILSAWCGNVAGDGPSLGFGSCRGVLLPAPGSGH